MNGKSRTIVVLGVNLIGADTVIFYDSGTFQTQVLTLINSIDWNPTCDAQVLFCKFSTKLTFKSILCQFLS